VTGLVACKAAYTHGDDWLDELLVYLEENINLLDEWAKNEKKVIYKKQEGTYLAWLDFRKLGLSDKELQHLLTKEAHVWLSAGQTFGAGGSGFMRANLALPHARLAEALSRISNALENL
jgi:cystathionine beta-lyase